ncbi:MAG: hypothetical protein IJH57_04450 [Mogibacterium sp.]|nr:hypothetical protein [Mogibacterium sp.]
MSEFDYSIYNKNRDKPEGFKKTGSKIRTPMSREQRAKQFAPFDALTGLHARLAKAVEEHRAESEAESLVHVELDDSEHPND